MLSAVFTHLKMFVVEFLLVEHAIPRSSVNPLVVNYLPREILGPVSINSNARNTRISPAFRVRVWLRAAKSASVHSDTCDTLFLAFVFVSAKSHWMLPTMVL